MINLVKRNNINIGILETDFDIFSDVVNTFPDGNFKSDCMLDLDDSVLPKYFKNKMTIAIQTNDLLIGYVIVEFKNHDSSEVEIIKLYVNEEFKGKGMEELLIDSVIYVAGEVGTRNVIVNVSSSDELLPKYMAANFFETRITEKGSILSVNVMSAITSRNLYDKFRDIPNDYVDYSDLKLVRKIASGRSGTIYLTDDNRILKMFTSTSFTYIKDREAALRHIKQIDVDEVVKPKNLVYYQGVFVGYIMDYLPEGDSLSNKLNTYSFEEKLEKLKKIEEVMKKLHKINIYICDLTMDNIFFDKDGNIKLIDCDAFVIKKNVINNDIDKKYIDPVYKMISKKTDMYAYAITSLEILIGERINKDATLNEIEKIYNKNKNKLPVSFKTYFEAMFKTKERYYMTDSYDNYINGIYNTDSDVKLDDKKGNVSVIILSILLLLIAVVGYLIFKYKISG